MIKSRSNISHVYSCHNSFHKMLKRKITATSDDNNKKQKATALTQSSLSSWVKPQPQEQTRVINPEALFNKVGKEGKELLSLEINTMNSEWLKALSEEIQKPYFTKVCFIFTYIHVYVYTNLTRFFFI